MKGKNQLGQRKAITVKNNNRISGLGYADLNRDTIYIRDDLGSERESIVEHEKAHFQFNEFINSKLRTVKLKKYFEIVMKAKPFSDDLERMKESIKSSSDKGDYIDEYHAQTKEVQQRIKDKLLNRKELDQSFFDAEKNLEVLF